MSLRDAFAYDAKRVFVNEGELGAAADFRADGLGVDIAAGGDFANPTDWTAGDGWTIAEGSADCDGTQTAASTISQPASLTEDVLYPARITVAVGDDNAGTVTVSIGGTAGTARSTAGTFTEWLAAGSGPDLAIEASVGFIGSVSAVALFAPVRVSCLQGERKQDTERDGIIAHWQDFLVPEADVAASGATLPVRRSDKATLTVSPASTSAYDANTWQIAATTLSEGMWTFECFRLGRPFSGQTRPRLG